MISYLITDPKYYGIDSDLIFENIKKASKKRKVDFVCFRDKKTKNYDSLANKLASKMSFLDVKFILHGNWELAKDLNAYGVHFPSNMLNKIQHARKNKLWVIASTHNLQEALFAQEQGASAVCISPIFKSPCKPNAIGLEVLKEMINKISIDVFALGGISVMEEIDACKKAGAKGFAAIRYFCD